MEKIISLELHRFADPKMTHAGKFYIDIEAETIYRMTEQ